MIKGVWLLLALVALAGVGCNAGEPSKAQVDSDINKVNQLGGADPTKGAPATTGN